VSNIRYKENKKTPKTQYRVRKKFPNMKENSPKKINKQLETNSSPPINVKSVLVVQAYTVREMVIAHVRLAAVITISGE
jgi:hypothetical protein